MGNRLTRVLPLVGVEIEVISSRDFGDLFAEILLPPPPIRRESIEPLTVDPGNDEPGSWQYHPLFDRPNGEGVLILAHDLLRPDLGTKHTIVHTFSFLVIRRPDGQCAEDQRKDLTHR